MNELVHQVDCDLPEDWSRIWALNIPPRVKLLCWRVCRDVGVLACGWYEATDRGLNHAVTLWNIWQRRNDAVWEGSLCDYELVIRRGDSFFQDWDRAKEAYKSRDISVEDVIQNRLIPLVHGRLKCNVDAAFLKETNSTGFGLRLRDPQVRMVVLRSCCVKPCMQFVEVEAYGLMLALQFVSNL
ncbi:hypothetical protein GLYMA_05G000650v4 [Glycine max]|nr:hypothetical protein GLYMA_05G000650v4 [Glycine max]KAG5056362.1 hypothetical protein JHK86_011358 [Glycine max]KAH1132086.1 hypothetical protein GYH30_011115 [Glycine max]